MSQRITHCFLDTDLRCQHKGLSKIASKQKVDASKLKSGQHLAFVNVALNKIKMYSPGNVVSYLRLDRGRIDLEALALIPQAFGHDIEVKYNSALKQLLLKRLRK